MNRSTIDFGIDLGTTNSAIALLKGVKAEVVKSNLDTDITPSAVYIGKNGNVIVGSRAKAKLEDDRSEVTRLFNQGARAMDMKDKETVRRCVIRLWDLSPQDVVEQAKRGHGSGVTI